MNKTSKRRKRRNERRSRSYFVVAGAVATGTVNSLTVGMVAEVGHMDRWQVVDRMDRVDNCCTAD